MDIGSVFAGDYAKFIRGAIAGDTQSSIVVKGVVKSKVAPLITEFMDGFGQDNLKQFIDSGGSIWDNLIAGKPEWKQKALQTIKSHQAEFTEFTSDAGLRFAMKTLAECDGLGWLPQVISPSYAKAEIQRIHRDLAS